MSEGIAQGGYVAARVGFEPAILRTQAPNCHNHEWVLYKFMIDSLID